MWKTLEKKASVWSRLDAESDIDVLIFGEHCEDDYEEQEND